MNAGLALQARDVQMTYRDKATGDELLAIEQLDLDIREGEFVCIVGPSGCGKSTFLKIVNGLLPAHSGTIEISKSEHGRDHAMVFQDSSLFPWYTILNNVSYGLVCAGIKKKEAQKRALPFIEMVGLKGFEEKYPYQLSGGMQQRANLARALTVDPEILLMDEPFAALDAQTRELMQMELLRIWREARKTVLFITHQIEEAVYLADRVIVMSRRPGRVLDDISIDLARPRGLDIKRSPEFIGLTDRIWELISGQLGSNLSGLVDDDLDDQRRREAGFKSDGTPGVEKVAKEAQRERDAEYMKHEESLRRKTGADGGGDGGA
jgi:NitT/TauT family transport system ATP-binding protein